MKTVLFYILVFTVFIGEIFAFVLYGETMNMILQKEKRWFIPLLAALGMLFVSSCLYTWLPELFGFRLGYEDLDLWFEYRDIRRNTGILFIMHAVSFGFAFAKYLWECIRRKNQFSIRLFLIYGAFLTGFIWAGYQLGAPLN